MSTLLALQQEFAQSVALLIQKAKALGYEVTLGEAWRTPEMAEIYAKEGKGVRESVHCQRLAIDLNLFKDGKYCADDQSGAYRTLGDFWKSLGPDYCWGGDFHGLVDLDHYSITPDGVHK